MCYLWTKDIVDVFHRIVRVFHYVVEQGGADAGAAQSNALATDLGYSDGMHDVGLARETAHALVGLLGKIESLVDDIHMFAMMGCQISVDEVLVSLAYNLLIFYLPIQSLFCHVLEKRMCSDGLWC